MADFQTFAEADEIGEQDRFHIQVSADRRSPQIGVCNIDLLVYPMLQKNSSKCKQNSIYREKSSLIIVCWK